MVQRGHLQDTLQSTRCPCQGRRYSRRGALALGRPGRDKWLTAKIPEFSDFVRSLPSQARDEDDLWASAETQKAAGDRRLHTFMMSRRDVAQILERTEKAEAAPLKVKRKAKNRVEILEQVVSDGRCSCSVEDQWLKSADEVAAYNGYENRELQSAILDALERGIFSSAHHALLFPIKPTRNLTAVLFL